MFKNILLEVNASGLATITLNRPEVYNSLDSSTCAELTNAFTACNNNPDVKVILLAAAGKGFCSGQDLKQLLESENIIPSDVIKRDYTPLILSMRESSKVIICKLHGVAVGAGCSLVFACDYIIASENGVLSQAFIGIGLVPDSGSTYFLPRLVGRSKAFELMTLGTKISAVEAVALGLINKVVSALDLDKETAIILSQYLQSPLIAAGLIKKMLNASDSLNLKQVLELEGEMQNIAASTEDFQEGIISFQQKRKPSFKGK